MSVKILSDRIAGQRRAFSWRGDRRIGAAVERTVQTLDRQAVERAVRDYPAGRLFLSRDCGFTTFSARPVKDADLPFQKLRNIVAASRALPGDASAAA